MSEGGRAGVGSLLRGERDIKSGAGAQVTINQETMPIMSGLCMYYGEGTVNKDKGACDDTK